MANATSSIVLKKFEFPTSGSAVQSKYDWPALLDGRIHKLTKGEHYESEESTFMMLAKSRAAKIGKALNICKVEDGIVLQVSGDLTEEQQAKFAEQEEARKAWGKKAREKKKAEKNGTAARAETTETAASA